MRTLVDDVMTPHESPIKPQWVTSASQPRLTAGNIMMGHVFLIAGHPAIGSGSGCLEIVCIKRFAPNCRVILISPGALTLALPDGLCCAQGRI